MENNSQNGSINIMMATNALTDSLSWPKKIDILNLAKKMNSNWFISVEDTWSI